MTSLRNVSCFGLFATGLSVLALGACGDDSKTADPAVTPTATATVTDENAKKPVVAGSVWKSGCSPSQQGGTYERYELDATATDRRFAYQVFSDAGCTELKFEIGNTNAAEIGKSVGKGAFALDVTFKSIFAIAHSSEGATALSGLSCAGLTTAEGFPVGKVIDAGTKGCGFFAPLATCSKDFDIVKVVDSKLFSGVFGANRCKEAGRPTALNTWNFDKATAPAKPTVVGIYKTACSPEYYNGSATGKFSFSEINAAATPRKFLVHYFADSACAQPLYDVGNENTATVGKAVPAIVGAYELDVTFTKVIAIAKSSAGATQLAAMSCAGKTSASDFAVDAVVDASVQGCSFFKPLSACPSDFDIIKPNGTRLYNGVFLTDRCVVGGRPTALNSWYFTMAK